jgi:hypothetical protein
MFTPEGLGYTWLASRMNIVNFARYFYSKRRIREYIRSVSRERAAPKEEPAETFTMFTPDASGWQ